MYVYIYQKKNIYIYIVDDGSEIRPTQLRYSSFLKNEDETNGPTWQDFFRQH